MHSNVLYGRAAPQDTGQRGVFLVSTVGPSTLQLCLAEHTWWVSWRALALGPPDVVVRLPCTQARATTWPHSMEKARRLPSGSSPTGHVYCHDDSRAGFNSRCSGRDGQGPAP